jgi:hypothetical protein
LEIERCSVAGLPFGRLGEAMRKGSGRSAATASATVAKLSSTYCAQRLIDSRGLPAAGAP